MEVNRLEGATDMHASRCVEPLLQQLLGSYELGLLSESEARRVEKHVLECDECFEELYETAPLMAAARRAMRKRERSHSWRIPLVAAAGIVLAFSVTYTVFTRGPEAKRGALMTEHAISLKGPEGVQKGDRLLFEWEAGEGFRMYTLSILDEEGDSVWSCETEKTETVLPLRDSKSLRAGKKYYWKVVGEDPSGAPEAFSPVGSFSLETVPVD
jgi:hypothetical protein